MRSGFWSCLFALLLAPQVWAQRTRLEFRSEFFNALNEVNFGNPNVTVNSATFGRITTAGSPRVIQLALKLLW